MIRVGYYQFAPVLKEREKNFELLREAILNHHEPMDILVLPEMFATGYNFITPDELEPLAEPCNGPTYLILRELAAERNMYLYGGFVEKDGKKLYNSAMLVSPDGTSHIYRKSHLFYYEKELFSPGDSPLEPIELTIRNEKVRVGLMICYDWIFPETARTYSLKGAQVLLHCANLVMPYCPAATITRSLENRVFIVLCDRTGKDSNEGREISFIGLSRVVNPKGAILIESGEKNEEIKTVEINPTEADNKNLNPFNNLFNDRRPDLYEL